MTDIEQEIEAIERHLLREALELEFLIRNELNGSQIYSRRKLEEQLDRMLEAWHWDGRLRHLRYKSPLGILAKQAVKDKNVNEPAWSPEYPDAVIEQLQSAIDRLEIDARKIIAFEAPPPKYRKADRVGVWMGLFKRSRRTYYYRLAEAREYLIGQMLCFRV